MDPLFCGASKAHPGIYRTCWPDLESNPLPPWKIQACYPLDPALLSSCWLTLKVFESLLRQNIKKPYQTLAHHFSSLSICIKCVNISQVRKAGQYSKQIEFDISSFWTLPRPQPPNWFLLFFMSDAYYNTLFSIFNPSFQIMTPDGAYSSVLTLQLKKKKYNFWPKQKFICLGHSITKEFQWNMVCQCMV